MIYSAPADLRYLECVGAKKTPRPLARSMEAKMYLPENNAQMFDILSELRIYAAANALPQLAEKLDDALVLLTAEATPTARRCAPVAEEHC